jgi:hypothetical protein
MVIKQPPEPPTPVGVGASLGASAGLASPIPASVADAPPVPEDVRPPVPVSEKPAAPVEPPDPALASFSRPKWSEVSAQPTSNERPATASPAIRIAGSNRGHGDDGVRIIE